MRENSTPKIGISNDRKNELQLGETNSNANQRKMGTTTKNGKSAEFLFHLYYLVNRKTDSWFCNSRDFKKNYEANEKKKKRGEMVRLVLNAGGSQYLDN